jgi:hypothetical protein
MLDDIQTVDAIIESGCGSNIVAAWGRIKVMLKRCQQPTNSQSDAISAYIKEFDILADDTVSKNIAFKGSLLLSKYASIFRRLLHT